MLAFLKESDYNSIYASLDGVIIGKVRGEDHGTGNTAIYIIFRKCEENSRKYTLILLKRFT